MKALFFSLFLFSAAAAFCQPVQSSCEAPDSIEALYEFDARVLAVREMQGGSPNEVFIQENRRKRFLDMLLTVYNAVELPARDSVVKCLPIHTFPEYSLQDVLVGANTSTTWVANWMNGVVPTGSAEVDMLIDTFELSLADVVEFPNGDVTLLVHSEFFLNIPALAAKFAVIQGVASAEPNYSAGDGDDIYAQPSPFPEYYNLFYEHGWGDCFAGCINHHTWVFFLVFLDCDVAFEESFGDPVDFPCELSSGSAEADFLEKFEVSPSLVSGEVRAKLASRRNAEGRLRLVSLQGQALRSLPVSLPGSVEVQVGFDTGDLPAGAYFLLLNVENQAVSKKVILQR